MQDWVGGLKIGFEILVFMNTFRQLHDAFSAVKRWLSDSCVTVSAGDSCRNLIKSSTEELLTRMGLRVKAGTISADKQIHNQKEADPLWFHHVQNYEIKSELSAIMRGICRITSTKTSWATGVSQMCWTEFNHQHRDKSSHFYCVKMLEREATV